MKTNLNCIPCFFRQTLEAAKIAKANEDKQKKIIKEVCKIISTFSLEESPPEITRAIYTLIREETGVVDPFKKIKDESNRVANSLYPLIKEKVKKCKDRLRASIELAIAGNVIDYGVKNSLNIEEEIEKIKRYNCLESNREERSIFHYSQFRENLKKAKRILYLADNAGEVVFDRILIEELEAEVIYAVKDKPVINDALMEDADACNVGNWARVISSGCDAPGTILKFCSEEFLEIYKSADLIISKGQGNFEALPENSRTSFFLFKVKCQVIAKYINAKMGDIILKGSEN